MKKMLALAAMISASTFAGAYAQDTGAPAPSTADVTIVNIANPPMTKSGTTPAAETRTFSPDVTQAAQAQVQSDPALQAAIRDKNVQVENIVAVETAGNGGKTVYIK